jgi:hypothetical protein
MIPVGEQVYQPDILPDTRGKTDHKWINGTWWVPVFCANCGTDGGYVPEQNMTFAFYLCDSCADKYGPIANSYMEPDAVFYQRIALAQLEEYGRLLGVDELLKALDDTNHPLAKLAREGLKRTQ